MRGVKVGVFIFFLFMCIGVVQVRAQGGGAGVGRTQEHLEHLLEWLLEQMGEDDEDNLEASDLEDRIEEWLRRPLNINLVNAEDLEGYLFLSRPQIEAILSYRAQVGRFHSIYELQAVEGLSLVQAQVLQHLLYVPENNPLRQSLENARRKLGEQFLLWRVEMPLEQALGYSIKDSTRSRYLGSNRKILLRYRYTQNPNLSLVLNFEKDAGEPFRIGHEDIGFDHISGSLYWKAKSQRHTWVLGDYQLQIAQGLCLWQGFRTNKGSLLHGVAKSGLGLKAHTSANEIDFLRGVAWQYQWGAMQIRSFVSVKAMDGPIEVDEHGKKLVKSLSKSGLHRTPYERANRGSVRQQIYGLDLNYQERGSQGGLYYTYTALNAHLNSSEALRHRFAFSGDHSHHLGSYMRKNLGNVHVFGEVAGLFQRTPAVSLVGGLFYHPHPHLSLAGVYRRYGKRYFAWYPQAFGFDASAQNEEGSYAGFQYQPHKRLSLVAYLDVAKFPWMKYRIDAPSHALDYFAELRLGDPKRGIYVLRFQAKSKNQNRSLEGQAAPELALLMRQNVRFSHERPFSEKWVWRFRLDGARVQLQDVEDFAWMLGNDLLYKPILGRIQGNVRLAYFDARNYEARLFSYENDVLYAGGVRAYYHRGLRTYLNLRIRVHRSTGIWLKYAITHRTDGGVLGSGLDAVPGSTKQDIKIQIQIRF